ncbi:tyrosine-type recombinase/integrase [Haloarcula laminariae]|uniref:tyrosine-type recombinase/integrase n=1 Tax=Haloarcula laminariae TaxID=2961577 RepID=UPI0021C5BC8F|nr:hypothetical protein [Halomicroarcula laminariae]
MPKSADSDSETESGQSSPGLERTKPWETADDVPWSLLNEAQLADAYDAVVAPALRSEDRDPTTDRPSYEWLSTNGFRGLTYALSTYHETTFSDFWQETLGYGEQQTQYDWGIEHDETRESLETYLDAKHEAANDWTESTRETIRYRLARYARSYRERHGTDDLLSPVDADTDITETEAVDRCRETFAYMGEQFADATIARVHDAIRNWYTWLVERRVATVNPTNGAEDWFGWQQSSDTDPVALLPEHVRAMFDTAVRSRDKMLLIALAGWGLRAGEVAALHEDQLVLDGESPSVEFEERKNGPGTVSIVYGADVAQRHCDRVDGYLFPSKQSQTGHVYPSTIATWFHDLADNAGVPEEIDGVERKPHMGRRFWYDAYSQTTQELLTHVQDIAAEQGSASAKIAFEDYLTQERKRELRREFMREKLSRAFTDSDA